MSKKFKLKTVEERPRKIKAPNKDGKLKLLLLNNSSVILAFFCSFAVTLLVFFCYGIWPFGDGCVFRMDLYHQYGPLFAELYERITGLRSLLYSWNTGGGGTFVGNFFNYLSSPIALIMLFFGHDDIPSAVGIMVLLKASLASATFAYYLNRSQGKHGLLTAGFGVLYSFCGYFIAYFWNVMWIDAMVLFPLVMLGIERIIHHKKFMLYSISLAAILITNYYMGYMVCIFSVLYFFVCYACGYSLNSYYKGIPTVTNKKGHQTHTLLSKIRYSRFLRSGLIFAFASVLAAALAAFALVPVYFCLKNCSATSGSFPTEFKTYFTAFDFIANHLPSIDPTIRSSGEDVLPNVYCGILTLILLPFWLFCRSIKPKEKTAFIVLLGVLFFSFNTNYLNFIWHGFHFPNDLPYRFSFMYSFILLIMAFKALKYIKQFTGRQIIASGLGTLTFIVLVEEIGSKNVTESDEGALAVTISIGLTLLYTGVLYMIKSRKAQAGAVSLLLLCCIIAEAAVADTDHFNFSQRLPNYTSDYSDFTEIKEQLDNYDTDSVDFYRMELTKLRARMDPAWYDYNGVSTFSSMAYEKLANLQSHLGMFSNFINSYTYNLQTPVYNSMMSLKYIVNNSDSVNMSNKLYTFLASVDKFNAYENKYYLPIAYCVKSDVLTWEHSSTNPFDVQADYFEKSTGLLDVFEPLPVSDVTYSNVESVSGASVEDGEIYLKRINSGAAKLFVTLTPEKSQNCYIYVDSSAVETVYAESDTVFIEQNINEPYILDIGYVEAGENVRVELQMKEESDSGTVSFYARGLNMPIFEKGYEMLNKSRLRVSTFEDTYIKGSVTAYEDCVLYTSIPFDEGWSVTLDGKRIPSEKYFKVGDALLAISLPAGEHTVEFSFTPQGMYLGIAISGCAVLFVVFILLLAHLLKKRRDKRYLSGVLDISSNSELDDLEGNFLGVMPIGGGSFPHGITVEDVAYIPSDDAEQTAPPEPEQYVAPEPQQYVAPEPQQYVAPEPQQYVAPEPQQYVAPEPQQYVAPEQQQYVAPEPQQYVAPEPEQYVAPEPEQYVAPEPEQYVAPEPEQYVAPEPPQKAEIQVDEKLKKIMNDIFNDE